MLWPKIADLLIGHMEETMSPKQAKEFLRDLKSFAASPLETARAYADE